MSLKSTLLNLTLFLNLAEKKFIVKDVTDIFTNSSQPSAPFNSEYVEK